MSSNTIGINSINKNSNFVESDIQDSQNEEDHNKQISQKSKSQSLEHLEEIKPKQKMSRSNTHQQSLPLIRTSRHSSIHQINKYQSQLRITNQDLDIEKNLLVKEENSLQDDQSVEINKASFKWLLKSCIEEALSFALEWAPSTIILYFITQNNNQDIVSGFGLGLVWSNCVGQGLYYGLSSGLETMASHAHGAKNYNLVGLLFQKTIFISLLLFIPIMLAMIFSKNILQLWNSEEIFCEVASQYCQLSLPGLFLACFYYSLKASLNAQNEYRIQVYTSAINLGTYLNMGVKGAALVFILSEFQNLTLLSIFTYSKKDLRKCFIPFTKDCFKDLKPFLKVAVPIGSIVAAEWIVFELNSIISSNLQSNQYSAHIVLANFSAMCFQFQIGYSTAASTFISNEMGKKNVQNAIQYTKYSIYIIFGHVAIVILPLIFLRQYIAGFFTVEQDVQDALLSAYFIFIIGFTLDSFQSIVTAYMRAIAQENYCCITFFLCYGAIGLTSSYLLAYQAHLNIKGIWYGMIIGIGSYVLLQIVQIIRVDINEMAEVIAKRVEEEEKEQQEQEAISDQKSHDDILNQSNQKILPLAN